MKFPNHLRFQTFFIGIRLSVTHEAIWIQGLSYRKSNSILLTVDFNDDVLKYYTMTFKVGMTCGSNNFLDYWINLALYDDHETNKNNANRQKLYSQPCVNTKSLELHLPFVICKLFHTFPKLKAKSQSDRFYEKVHTWLHLLPFLSWQIYS